MSSIVRILILLIAGQLFVFTSLSFAGNPTADLLSPKIDHNIVTGSIEAGNAYQIKAVVTDNIGVEVVYLFYRAIGDSTYKRTQMSAIAGTDEFTSTLGYEEIVEPGIEYYFQAKDYQGNSLLLGYSFSPLRLSIAKNVGQSSTGLAQAKSEEDTRSKEKQEGKINKWVWIGLGVLAVGVVAAISGNEDSGGEQSAAKPGKGTIIISGPSP